MTNPQIEAGERALLRRLPFDADHVPDDETPRFDARLTAPFVSTPPVVVFEGLSVDAGTPVELKTCQVWVEHFYSNGGRRRGAFQISKVSHEALVEERGVYSLNVLDGERILAGALVPADVVDDLASWSRRKRGRPKGRLPWRELFDVERVEGVEEAATA